MERLDRGGRGRSAQPAVARDLSVAERSAQWSKVDWRQAWSGSIGAERSAGQLCGCGVGIVSPPGKEHRLKIEHSKFLVVEARRFILGGEVVAPAIGGHQQCRHAGLARRQHAQFHRTARHPGHVLVAPDQNSGQPLGFQPFHQLFMFCVQLRIPRGFRDQCGAIHHQALANSLAHDWFPFWV